jgi:hypothetical protein
MRDDQVQRYARHLKLADVGGLGQTALLRAAARVQLREREPAAELIAATYLVAGGVGAVTVPNATDAQLAELGAHGPDTRVTRDPSGPAAGSDRAVELAPRPPWWPGAPGDDLAVASWRGATAATRWMTETIEK